MPWWVCLFIWAPRSQNRHGFWFSKTCLFSVYSDFSGLKVNWFHLIKFLVFKWVSTSFYCLLPKNSNGHIPRSKLGPTSYSILYSTHISKAAVTKYHDLGGLKQQKSGVRWGWGGLRGREIYVYIADSCCCTAETNTTLRQLYSNKKGPYHLWSILGKITKLGLSSGF